MTKELKKFDEVLTSYVYLKECAAIKNERAELDLDEDIYDLEDYRDDLINIVNKYNIKTFKIADDSDIDELREYVLYLENKLIDELHYRLTFMYQYDK
jgi:hypothetical protein